MSRKLLIIGLDGATFDLLDPLMDDGRMPNLRGLAAKGVRSDLLSVIPPVTPAAWTSFMTGKSPAKHGIFHFRQFDPLTGEERVHNSASISDTTLWEYMSAGGISVGVVNVPMTFPPLKVNGFLVSGVDTPSLREDYTYPPELKEEISFRFPNYGLLPALSFDSRSDRDFRAKVQRAIDYVNTRC
jgi:predicted AlkP superfamily phosphohydrolase/phosphomutase